LIKVLRRRRVWRCNWNGPAARKTSATFCTEQYNRVLTRLKEMDPGVGVVFEPLPAGSSLTVVAMASRQLAAYYEDELGPSKGFGRGYGFAFDPKMFKEFWEKSSREFEDMGEFIRESIDEWLRHKKEASRAEKGSTETKAE
jgi:hypothetical protein